MEISMVTFYCYKEYSAVLYLAAVASTCMRVAAVGCETRSDGSMKKLICLIVLSAALSVGGCRSDPPEPTKVVPLMVTSEGSAPLRPKEPKAER